VSKKLKKELKALKRARAADEAANVDPTVNDPAPEPLPISPQYEADVNHLTNALRAIKAAATPEKVFFLASAVELRNSRDGQHIAVLLRAWDDEKGNQGIENDVAGAMGALSVDQARKLAHEILECCEAADKRFGEVLQNHPAGEA